jgi:hypothetical protein
VRRPRSFKDCRATGGGGGGGGGGNYCDTLIDLVNEKLLQLMEPDSKLGRLLWDIFLVSPLREFNEALTTESW